MIIFQRLIELLTRKDAEAVEKALKDSVPEVKTRIIDKDDGGSILSVTTKDEEVKEKMDLAIYSIFLFWRKKK